MKIRQGFVSNSSSSSFIVAFPRNLEISTDSVKEYLFKDKTAICAYDWHGTFSTEQIAEQVANDMSKQTPNDDKEIQEAMGGHLPGAPNYEAFRVRKADGKGYDYDWDAYEKANTEFSNKMAEKIKQEFGEMNIFTFEYSDNDGSFFCTMEHGGIFDGVPHLRVSNH